MTENSTDEGFRSRPRTTTPDPAKRDRQLAELARLRNRLGRAARDGEAAFITDRSDSHDIGALAIINITDFVAREPPLEIVAQLPRDAVQGLRRTRNIAAHENAELGNGRLWLTVSVYAPALISTIEITLSPRPEGDDHM